MEQQFYECHKHGVQIGGHCDQCEIRVFIPPLVMQAEIDKGWREVADTALAFIRRFV